MTFGQSFLLWRQFEKQQWLSYQELKKIQERRLRTIVRWAYDTVPYYHQIFREKNLFPEDIVTVEDLQKLPVLTKKDVQEHQQELRSKGVPSKGLRTQTTTGSTGIPLEMVQDPMYVAACKAVLLRAFRANGLRFTDRILRIKQSPYKSSWYERFGIFPNMNASVYESPEQLARKCNTIKPDVIYAYPSILQAISSTNIPLRPVRRVFSMAETLSRGARIAIQNAFHTQVADFYGSTEFGSIAWECPFHEGHHINVDHGVVECCDGNGEAVSGKAGEVIITGFFNYAMPLIRYALGDMATLSKEKGACGRGLPLLKTVEGRKDEWLTMPNGERISPMNVNAFEDIRGIKEFRIVQTRRDHIVVEVLPSDSWTESLSNAIISRIKKGLGNHDVTVDAKPVSYIPRGPNGKMRTVISHVSTRRIASGTQHDR